jgi:DUF4097 and DUF4098 domain-containing protein YvlB
MKKITLSFILLAFLFSSAIAQKVVDKKFKATETVSISTVSGNCIVKKGGDDEIKVHLTYTFDDDCFSYKFKEKAGKLEISEKFSGRSCRGESNWEITVPENTEVLFNTASGNAEINAGSTVDVNTASGDVKINVGDNIKINTASGDISLSNLRGNTKINSASGDIRIVSSKGNLKVNTASGKVKAENLSGDVKINTASGNIELEKSAAVFSANTASGDIDANNIVINEASVFSSASGDVLLSLGKSTAFDLTLSSASGNSTLDHNGNSLNGYYEFTARVKKGRIVSPIKFDKEEIVEKHGKKYDVKSFTKGKSAPVIKIKTATGTAKLIK